MDEDDCFQDSMKMYIATTLQNITKRKTPVENRNFLQKYNRKNHEQEKRNTKYSVSTVTSQTFCDVDLENKLTKLPHSHLENLCTYLNDKKEIPVFELDELPGTFVNSKKLITCLMFMIQETYPIKEIWLKSKKTWITTAMAVVSDFTGKLMKLTLWRKQCHHLFSWTAGCIVCISNVMTWHFGNEMMLRLTQDSTVYSLGRADELNNELTRTAVVSSDCKKDLMMRLKEECKNLVIKYPLLFDAVKHNLAPSLPNVELCDFRHLAAGMVVHIRAKIISFNFRTKDPKNPKVTLGSLDGTATCVLFLHGSAQSWTKKLTIYRKHTWEFRFLACGTLAESDSVELHTSVLSTAECLFHEDDKAILPSIRSEIHTFDDLDSAMQIQKSKINLNLSRVYTGSVECVLGLKTFLLTSSTPVHLIERAVEKSLVKSSKTYYTAKCFFEKQNSEKYFHMIICKAADKSKVQEAVELIKNLLSNVCHMSVTVKNDAEECKSQRNTIIFNEFISI